MFDREIDDNFSRASFYQSPQDMIYAMYQDMTEQNNEMIAILLQKKYRLKCAKNIPYF